MNLSRTCRDRDELFGVRERERRTQECSELNSMRASHSHLIARQRAALHCIYLHARTPTGPHDWNCRDVPGRRCRLPLPLPMSQQRRRTARRKGNHAAVQPFMAGVESGRHAALDLRLLCAYSMCQVRDDESLTRAEKGATQFLARTFV